MGRRIGRRAVAPTLAPLVDAVAWLVGIPTAMGIRYDFDPPPAALRGALLLAGCAVAGQLLLGHRRFLYRGRHPSGTFDEVRAVCAVVAGTAAAVLLVDLLLPVRPAPASSPLVGGVLAGMVMLAARSAHRLHTEVWLRDGRRRGVPALLFGAGATGADLARALLRDATCGYRPVGFLDDDPGRRHLWVHGVPVLGGRADLATAVAATGAGTVICAVGSADAELLRQLEERATAAGVAFKVLPSVREILDGRARLAEVREMRVTDLLGRRQLETDLPAVAGYLSGKRVLVTGAGGSIGSELCRQLQHFAPAELIMLDRDESALHAVQLSLDGRALLDSAALILADLRDSATVRRVFADRRPEVVFHTAALKHLPLLQRFPGEAVLGNVWATQELLEAARGVERFVNISTDKAANPCSVLGYSKRITERLTAYAARAYPGVFLNVRFGNVLGSRGSVLVAFTAQAAAGGPITVTHPEVTRYFMTVQEAVQLVILAAAIGRDGEALVLDMGKPVRINDVARRVAGQGDDPVEIVYTGLRPGEKLHEELFGAGEADVRPRHPLVSHVPVPPLHPDRVRLLDPAGQPDELVAGLAALCTASDRPLLADAKVRAAAGGRPRAFTPHPR